MYRTNWKRLATTPLPGRRGAARRRLSVSRQGRRGQGDRPVAAVAASDHDDAGRIKGVGRPARADDAPRRASRPVAPLRHHLVLRRHPQVPPRARQVLVASFFLQLFALVSPLFFQVVIDKVLVHRSLGTLDVLVIGLVTISVFETILGILRTYVFRPYHQPHRRRTRRPPVPSSAGFADRLFPGAAGRRFGRARARAGKHPQFSRPVRRSPSSSTCSSPSCSSR